MSNNISIEKYNYKVNNIIPSTDRSIKIKQKKYKNCLLCRKVFVEKDTKKYCSYKCAFKAARKYNFDVKNAIEKVKEIGWSGTARELNLS